MLHITCHNILNNSSSRCLLPTPLMCFLTLLTSILPYSFSHTVLCTGSFWLVLLVSSLVLAPGLLPLKAVKIYTSALHSTPKNGTKTFLSLHSISVERLCVFLYISPNALFLMSLEITRVYLKVPCGEQAALLQTLGFPFSSALLCGWFIHVSSSQKNAYALCILKHVTYRQ